MAGGETSDFQPLRLVFPQNTPPVEPSSAGGNSRPTAESIFRIFCFPLGFQPLLKDRGNGIDGKYRHSLSSIDQLDDIVFHNQVIGVDSLVRTVGECCTKNLHPELGSRCKFWLQAASAKRSAERPHGAGGSKSQHTVGACSPQSTPTRRQIKMRLEAAWGMRTRSERHQNATSSLAVGEGGALPSGNGLGIQSDVKN